MVAPRSVCFEFFGVPNSGSTSGSIFNGFRVDLCLFFVVFGIYSNRFGMILDIKIQPFWNRVRFSIPYPPERPNAKHQVSNFGICQDLPESARSLPGSARNLPRISWSTIASTHLPHIHWPRNASQVTNCQAPKRGGGGDRPLAAFNEYGAPQPRGASYVGHLPSSLVRLISLVESLDWPRAFRSAVGSFFPSFFHSCLG